MNSVDSGKSWNAHFTPVSFGAARPCRSRISLCAFFPLESLRAGVSLLTLPAGRSLISGRSHRPFFSDAEATPAAAAVGAAAFDFLDFSYSSWSSAAAAAGAAAAAEVRSVF